MNKWHQAWLFCTVALGLVWSSGSAQTFTTIKSFGILTNITGFNPRCQLVQGPDGLLYGTASYSEGNINGTVFKVQADGSGFTSLKQFSAWAFNSAIGAYTNSDGAWPPAGLSLSGSVLYGTTYYGGHFGSGTVFKLNSDGTDFRVLKHFSAIEYDPATGFSTNSEGGKPFGPLTLSGGMLYGTTPSGGSSGFGVVFRLNTNGTDYTVLKQFSLPGSNSFNGTYTNCDGGSPRPELASSGTSLYGITVSGGNLGYGTVFKLNTDGTDFAVLRHVARSDGWIPEAGLSISGSILYGTMSRGSDYNGTVFKLNTDGTGFAVIKRFTEWSDGATPRAPVIVSGNVLYGTTSVGGSSSWYGTVFKVNTDGTDFTVVKHFDGSPDGASPYAGLKLSGNVLYGTTYGGGSMDLGTVFKVNTDGTGYSILSQFALSDGFKPCSQLTASGNVLYGATCTGGSTNNGTLFKIKTDGTGYRTLKNFSAARLDASTGYTYTNNDGAGPYSSLTLFGNVLYGTANSGGRSGEGTIFKLNTDGAEYTVLKHFSATTPDPRTGYTNSDGAGPYAELTLSGKVCYGTTFTGGNWGNGTVFRINTDGTDYAVLKHFSARSYSGTNSDGANPLAGLTQFGRVLYGATYAGGSADFGTLFKLNIDGSGYTVLKDFSQPQWDPTTGISTNSDGASPRATLTRSGDLLYGTTHWGGSLGAGTLFKVNSDGTGYTVLKDLEYNDWELHAEASVAVLGNVIYGTTLWGGGSGYGAVFKINTDGTGYRALKVFSGGSDGANPQAGLTLCGNGLYGTTTYGGDVGYGTVFRLDLAGSSRGHLTARAHGNALILSWADPTCTLQWAPDLAAAYTNIQGATSPYTNAISGPRGFFRLIGN